MASDALSDTLVGVYPTCQRPDEVELANSAFGKEDWDEYRQFVCSMLAVRGLSTRVIRCGTDVTFERMKQFSRPVPHDDSLPARVCEVEVVREDGSTVIGYTLYLNIERPE